MLGSLLESAIQMAPATSVTVPSQLPPASLSDSTLMAAELIGVFFLVGIFLFIYLALAVGVANEAAAKGYNYWDYFLSSFFGNHWGTRAVVHSLPHKTRLPDSPDVGSPAVGARSHPGRKASQKPECHACNAPVAPDDGFCGTCGARQRWDETVREPVTMECASCSASIPATANYCSACGTAVPRRSRVST